MYELSDEAELVAGSKNGDERAFARLYDGLFPGVYGYACMRLPSNVEAEDIVSQTFLAVLDQLDDFDWRGAGTFRAWVFRILRNHIADFYRHNGRRNIEALSEGSWWQIDQSGSTLERSVQHAEQRERLLRSINKLSPRQREIVRLRYFAGLRNRDIAQVLGLKERTISSHLSRALASLAEGLQVQEIEDGRL